MKKLKAIILAFVLVFSTVSTVAASNNTAHSSEVGNSKVLFLKMLDIVDVESFDLNSNISRGMFVDMLISAMNLEPAMPRDGVFSDVGSSTQYAGAIIRAYDLGIINGDGGLFRAEGDITFEAAVKIMVKALDYESIAMAYGGYPTGYIKVANDVDLIRGVNTEESFSAVDVVNLIYNFLHTDICRVYSITDDSFNRVQYEGVCPLTEFFDLKKLEGVIKTAGYVTMIPDESCDEYAITVNGITLKTNIDNAESYLGLSVDVWYNEETKIVECIDVFEHNTTVNIKASQIEKYNNKIVYVYDELTNKEFQYRLSPSFTFVKNGRNKIPDDNDFMFDDGELILTDNDGDKKYDVVYAKSAEYMIVSSVDTIDDIVYDSVEGKHLFMGSGDGYCTYLKVIDEAGMISDCRIENLKANMVLKYYISDDGYYVEAIACNEKLEGTVEEIAEDGLVIDGAKYHLNSYFDNTNKIEAGNKHTFFVASDKTLTYADYNRSGIMNYGYFINFKEGNGLAQGAKMAILTAKNEIIYPNVSSKIIFNSIKSNVSELKEHFINGNSINYQVIRYALDDSGDIFKIDTATEIEVSSYSEESLQNDYYGDDSLTSHFRKKNVYWYSGNGILSPFAILGSKTVIFSVPASLKDGITENIDVEKFSVITKDSLPSYKRNMCIDAYDLNKQLEPGVIVIYNEDASDTLSVHKEAAPAIVKGVTLGFNTDDEITNIIHYYQNGRSQKIPITSELNRTIQELPEPGDIIRVALNSDGEIAGLKIDVKYVETSDRLDITSEDVIDGQVDHSYYTGKSYVHSGNALTLLVDSYKYSEGYSDSMIGGISAFAYGSGCYITYYNTQTQETKRVSAAAIKDAVSVGGAEASKIVIKCLSHNIQHLFIYE